MLDTEQLQARRAASAAPGFSFKRFAEAQGDLTDTPASLYVIKLHTHH